MEVTNRKQAIKKFIDEKKEEARRKNEPLSIGNWYERAADAFEDLGDALMRKNSGTSAGIVRVAAGKLGAIGTSAGIFSMASLLGTASTGTAIGSLSGAAFQSAALAWLGGSMAAGSLLLGITAVAGSVGAVAAAGWVSKKFLWGKQRSRVDLSVEEQRILDVSLALASAFREQEKAGRSLGVVTAHALYKDALKPLCENFLECRYKAQEWPVAAQHRIHASFNRVLNITGFVFNWSQKNPGVPCGVVAAVIFQLFADSVPEFNGNEMFVLEALRRSNNSLREASDEELSLYVKSMSPEQLAGLENNIKGIYHELLVQEHENTDGDEYFIRLFEATNHPGADIQIINSLTGEVKDVQLKATSYLDYVERHNTRYSNIEVFATSEVADKSDLITSSGFSNEGISDDVGSVFTQLSVENGNGVLESMSVAGLVTLARNAKVLLLSSELSQKDKENFIREGVTAAGVAGLLQLVL